VKHSEPTPPPPPPPAPSEPEAGRHTALRGRAGRGRGSASCRSFKSTKEDTLHGHSPRPPSNVGYEEILRAKSESRSPGCQGLTDRSWSPRSSVIPNAPRTGCRQSTSRPCDCFYFPPHKSGEPQVVITHPIGIGKGGLGNPGRRDQDCAPPGRIPPWARPGLFRSSRSIARKRRGGSRKSSGPVPENPLG